MNSNLYPVQKWWAVHVGNIITSTAALTACLNSEMSSSMWKYDNIYELRIFIVQYGSTHSKWQMTLRRCNLDFHRGRHQIIHFFFNSVSNTLQHSSCTGQNDTVIQIIKNIYIRFHNRFPFHYPKCPVGRELLDIVKSPATQHKRFFGISYDL